MGMTWAYAPIEKTIDQEDGSVLVYGKATDGSLDGDLQRCDPAWLAEAMPKWYRTGANVREQHDSKRAIGKGVDHEVTEDGAHYVTARIVDPVAVLKTRAGVFNGFSIGIRNPKITKADDAPNGRINGGEIIELSLCDRPSNPECLISLVKAATPGMEIAAADFDEASGLVRCEELIDNTGGSETGANKGAVPTDMTSQDAGEVDAARNPGDSPRGCGCCDKCVGGGDECCDMCMPALKTAKKKPVDQDEDEDNDGDDDDAEKTITGDADAAAKALDEVKAAVDGLGGKQVTVEVSRDKALDLVKAVLAKEADGGAMPPEYSDEQGDIMNAQAAIAIISQLIVSEAQEMCDNPAEDCDIEILLQAVSALRCFICREQQQAMGEDEVDKPVPVLALGERPDLIKGKYSAEQLRQMLKDGKAIANADGEPSFPIGDREDLENAIHAVGRGGADHDKIRAYIIRRAKALGASSMIPENWSSGGSNDAEKTIETSDELLAAAKAAGEDVNVNVEVNVEVDDDANKTTEPDAAKAVGAVDSDLLVKALNKALEDEESALRKTFVSIVEASTGSAVKQLGELSSRLERVEQMATPGGPALRRTEDERKQARANDLLQEAAKYKALATGAQDPDLRKGYAALAAQYESQVKAL